jgi:hypothetical protein
VPEPLFVASYLFASRITLKEERKLEFPEIPAVMQTVQMWVL